MGILLWPDESYVDGHRKRRERYSPDPMSDQLSKLCLQNAKELEKNFCLHVKTDENICGVGAMSTPQIFRLISSYSD